MYFILENASLKKSESIDSQFLTLQMKPEMY